MLYAVYDAIFFRTREPCPEQRKDGDKDSHKNRQYLKLWVHY